MDCLARSLTLDKGASSVLLHFLITDVISLPKCFQTKLKMTPAWAVFFALCIGKGKSVGEGDSREIPASVEQFIQFWGDKFKEGANNPKDIRL